MNARTTPANLMPPERLDVIARGHKLGAARELIRSARIHDESELLQALQNILSACEFRSGYTDQVLDLCTDMDSELNEDAPELSSIRFSEPGELDGATVGVRGRA